VIGHRTVGKQPRLKSRDSLFKNRLERLVVSVVVENRHPRVRAIEHMINITPFNGSMRSSHAEPRYAIDDNIAIIGS
jgi:hypothetical protein